MTTTSPEWLLLRELLERRDEATLRKRAGGGGRVAGHGRRQQQSQAGAGAIARSDPRGAGGLARRGQVHAGRRCWPTTWTIPFVELSREIEKFAGCSVGEIQGLYGQNAYRRYERRALEEAIQIYPEAVIATPGGIVSDAATFNQHAGPLHHRVAAGARPRTT